MFFTKKKTAVQWKRQQERETGQKHVVIPTVKQGISDTQEIGYTVCLAYPQLNY